MFSTTPSLFILDSHAFSLPFDISACGMQGDVLCSMELLFAREEQRQRHLPISISCHRIPPSPLASSFIGGMFKRDDRQPAIEIAETPYPRTLLL